MDLPERLFDAKTLRKLQRVGEREATVEEVYGSHPADARILEYRLNALAELAFRIAGRGPAAYSGETKRIGTAFVVIDQVGRVHTLYRVPQQPRETATGLKEMESR